ncbi:MAG: hypothetical protein IPM85_12315 [Chitinophagaceae bacterium]|nr:hypothetical protein [Chitinophagaceae bacterium]
MRNVFSLLLFLTLLSCKGQNSNNNLSTSSKIGPDDFEKAIQNANVQVLDVRTSGEFQRGHIKNALQADMRNMEEFAGRVQHMDKNKPVYLYCLVGNRSAYAADWMRENGFTNVVELAGGINSWKMYNKPVEGVTNEPQITLEQFMASIPTDKTTLVDFGAKWCPPCVKMEPVLEELKNNKQIDFNLVKIDGGLHTNLMAALQLEPIPVSIIYKRGKEVWRKQGIIPKEELIAQLK